MSWPPPHQGPVRGGGSLLERKVLDEQMAWSRHTDPRPWGVWPWLGPVLVTVVLIIVGQLIRLHLPDAGGGRVAAAFTYTLVAEALVVTSVWLVARGPAARAGGWRTLLGLDDVRRADWLPWLLGVLATLVGRFALGAVAIGLSHGRAVTESQNLHLTHPSRVQISLLIIAAVLVAPVVEETVFRGLMLRTFMRRLRFWPSALLSTAVFALFHIYEVSTLVGALTLAAGVFWLGLTNCYLVRITGRLAPGIMVHATFNLLAVVVAVHRATH